MTNQAIEKEDLHMKEIVHLKSQIKALNDDKQKEKANREKFVVYVKHKLLKK